MNTPRLLGWALLNRGSFFGPNIREVDLFLTPLEPLQDGSSGGVGAHAKKVFCGLGWIHFRFTPTLQRGSQINYIMNALIYLGLAAVILVLSAGQVGGSLWILRQKLSPGIIWIGWIVVFLLASGQQESVNLYRVLFASGPASAVYHITTQSFRGKRKDEEEKKDNDSIKGA